MVTRQNPPVDLPDNDDYDPSRDSSTESDSDGTDDSNIDEGNPQPEIRRPGLEDIDTDKVKEHALKEGVEPVADEIFKKITTDPKTAKMIEDWNKLSREEQRLLLRADASMLEDALKANIPLYQFYHSWKMFSSAKKRALVYYGILPMEESEIRQIEESYGLRDKVAALGIKAIGFFLPEFQVLNPYVAGYVAGAEFNKQFARKVRVSVREKVKMENTRKEIHERAVLAGNPPQEA